MGLGEKLTEKGIFRLFKDELLKVKQIITHARDKENGRKYENISHFYRCAVIKLINEEKQLLDVKKGRPRK